jgi:hypothetical protein
MWIDEDFIEIYTCEVACKESVIELEGSRLKFLNPPNESNESEVN